MKWIPVEKKNPKESDVYAALCKDRAGSTYRVTALWTGSAWHTLGTMKQALVELTHWLPLPSDVPPHRGGAPVSLLARRSHYYVIRRSWPCPHCGFEHKHADLVRVSKYSFRCAQCGQEFPSSVGEVMAER